MSQAPISPEPPFETNGVPLSDLSTWDSTENEEEGEQIPSNSQFGLGMKHSSGMMDLSKVLSEEPNLVQQSVVPAVLHDKNEERIYDTVENLLAESQVSMSDRLQDNASTNLSPTPKTCTNTIALEGDNLSTKSPEYEKLLQHPREHLDTKEISDWDSPPVSQLSAEKRNVAIQEELSYPVHVKATESTFASEKKQNGLIHLDPCANGSNRRILPSSQQISSPSLIHKIKDLCPEDDSVSRICDDNQPNSLPTNVNATMITSSQGRYIKICYL